MNLPNKLTMLRLLLVPIFVLCFYIGGEFSYYIAAAVFIIAYITDILDGRIARKTDCVSDFGKLMDPIADKTLTAAALIMLTANGDIPAIATLIIIAREFAISGFRLVAAGGSVVIAASKLGKLKTVSQCVAIVLVLAGSKYFSESGFRFDLLAVWISVALTVFSGIDYVYKNRKLIKF